MPYIAEDRRIQSVPGSASATFLCCRLRAPFARTTAPRRVEFAHSASSVLHCRTALSCVRCGARVLVRCHSCARSLHAEPPWRAPSPVQRRHAAGAWFRCAVVALHSLALRHTRRSPRLQVWLTRKGHLVHHARAHRPGCHTTAAATAPVRASHSWRLCRRRETGTGAKDAGQGFLELHPGCPPTAPALPTPCTTGSPKERRHRCSCLPTWGSCAARRSGTGALARQLCQLSLTLTTTRSWTAQLAARRRRCARR